MKAELFPVMTVLPFRKSNFRKYLKKSMVWPTVFATLMTPLQQGMCN